MATWAREERDDDDEASTAEKLSVAAETSSVQSKASGPTSSARTRRTRISQ
jgi:hypothetical protein